MPNPRRVKVHRNYTVEEAARCVGVHKNTVRRWIKEGLPTIGGRGRTLVLGSVLYTFLVEKRRRAKRPCPLGFMFCLKCRDIRQPAQGMIEYRALTPGFGNLVALCPECSGLMFRRIKHADVAHFQAECSVALEQPLRRLVERPSFSLNCDSLVEAEADEDAPSRQ
jgi:hypothetical protein